MATKKTDSTADGQGGAAAKKSGPASKTTSAAKSAPTAPGVSAQKSAQLLRQMAGCWPKRSGLSQPGS